MQFVHKPLKVDAIQMKLKTTITNGDEEIHAEPGDWLIVSELGEQFVMSNKEFKIRYQPTGSIDASRRLVGTADQIFDFYREKRTVRDHSGKLEDVGDPEEEQEEMEEPEEDENELEEEESEETENVMEDSAPVKKAAPPRQEVKPKETHPVVKSTPTTKTVKKAEELPQMIPSEPPIPAIPPVAQPPINEKKEKGRGPLGMFIKGGGKPKAKPRDDFSDLNIQSI